MAGAFGDYDTIASFDRTILVLMIPLVKSVGGVLAHAVYCLNISKSMEYTLSTGHGISAFKYCSTAEAKLQRSGQGGSKSPIICTCSSDVILDAMEEAGHPSKSNTHHGRKKRHLHDLVTNSWTNNPTEQYFLAMASKNARRN